MSRFASDLSAPGWLPQEGTLDRLRTERSKRRVARQLFEGAWRAVLIEAGRSQYRFPKTLQEGERIDALLHKINLVHGAMMLHADVVSHRPPTLSVPEEFALQDEALIDIRRRCLFDAAFHEAALVANVESRVVFRCEVDERGRGLLCLDDNDIAFDVGPRGPDRQPTVWERRWVVRRGRDRFLRVERHRAIDGVGIVEQEAYATSGSETLVDLSELKRVALARAMRDGQEPPDDVRETGVDLPLLVELQLYMYRGRPQGRVNPDDIDSIDQMTARMSQLSRSIGLHASPKLRVSEEMIDDDGNLKPIGDAIIDEAKLAEYINASFDLNGLLNATDRAMQWVMVDLEVSPALMGVKPGGGQMPDTADKMRLEATRTLAAANRSEIYYREALGRAFTIVSTLDAQRVTAGYAVAPVEAQIHAGLPKDNLEEARELRELVEARLISRYEALRRLHGDEDAQRIFEELEEEAGQEARRQREALFGAVEGAQP